MNKEVVQALADALARAGGAGRMRPAKAEDLELAKKAGFPRELIDFYATCEPHPDDFCIELEQRVSCIAQALSDNSDAVPGVGLFPHGYIVFATTTSGDAYCLDTNVKTKDGQHPIVLFGHEAIDEYTELPYIQASRVEVASSLDDFLLKFSAGKLSEKVHYPPR